MKIIVVFFIILSPFSLDAGNGSSIGGRSNGMGGFSQTFRDVWATKNNVAGLAFLQKTSFGIYLENKFLLKETSYRSLALCIPSKKGNFGLNAGQYGYSLYNENEIGLSYSKLLGENISLGVQLTYYHTKIAESYGSKSAISGNVGLIAEITDDFHIGTSIINPTKAKLSEYQDERYPTIIKMGASYCFSKKVILGAELDKNMENPAVFRTGIEYQPVKKFYLRAGISTAPMTSTFGFGLKLHYFQVDFASSFQSVLGFSPHISLMFSPHGNKNRN